MSDSEPVRELAGRRATVKSAASLSSGLAAIRDAFIVVAVFLYVVGFEYLREFHDYFGIGVSEINTPLYTVLFYAFRPIAAHPREFAGLYVLPVVLGVAATLIGLRMLTAWLYRYRHVTHPARWERLAQVRLLRLRRRVRSRSFTVAIIAIGAVFLTFRLSNFADYAADAVGKSFRMHDSGLTVQFLFKPDATRGYGGAFLSRNGACQLWLVTESDKAYFAMFGGPPPAKFDVYRVVKDDLALVRMVDDQDGDVKTPSCPRNGLRTRKAARALR